MEGDSCRNLAHTRSRARQQVTAYLDTNVLVRHITGDPPDQAQRATAYLLQAENLLLPDLIVAEAAYVLASIYNLSRARIAQSLKSLVLSRAIVVPDAPLLLRTLELYDSYRLDFADAYLIASAEVTGVGAVASFDRDIDRPGTVARIEPS